MLLTRLRQVCDGSNKLVVLKPGPEKISVRDAQKASALRLHGKVSWVGSLGIMAGWIRGEVQWIRGKTIPLNQWMVSKTKLHILNKTKQKDELISRLLTSNLGNSKLWEQSILSRLQAKGFLWGNAAVIQFFPADWLPSRLSYLDQGSCVKGSRKSREGVIRVGIWGLAGVLCWFLSRAVHSCNLD